MAVDLATILDLEKWQQVQDALAKTTHLAIILVDYRGRPVTAHSGIQPFCKKARQDPALAVYCEKCDARGGLEAVRQGRPFVYRCHFDIVDMAIPILIDDTYIGAIMAGEIRLEQGQEQLEQVFQASAALTQPFIEKHAAFYQQYPILSLSALTTAADMLEHLSEYILSEALKKDYLVKAYKKSLRINQTEQAVPLLEELQHSVKRTLLEDQLDEHDMYHAKNQLLQPAIDAVFENKAEHLDLSTLADLANLSPSYLSRLFKEEFGEPFSHMYAKLKIHWAKQLLQTTTLSVNEISDALGFVESSYFIRSFKKNTGTTPLKYRRQPLD